MDGMGWDGIYLRQLGTLEHLAVLIICLFKSKLDKQRSVLDSDGLEKLWGATGSSLLMLVIPRLLSERRSWINFKRLIMVTC